jgi:preprotein translocase subunit SecB
VDTTVPFTLGGTAVNGTNYTGVSASPLVITAGSTTGTITGTLLDDGKFDSVNKTLVFTLGKPTNATLGATNRDTLTILETGTSPTVSLASAAQAVNESDGTFSVAVNLSAVSAADTTVPFTLSGTALAGVNYSGVTLSPLVIKAGSTSGTITGTLIDDGKFDTSGRTLTVTLGTPTNATLGAITSDTLSIAESDPEPTVSFASATGTANEKDGTFSVAVNLSAASAVDTTVAFSLGGGAAAGVNYSGVTPSPLVIKAGKTSATITGTLLDDGKYDTVNKDLVLSLGTPTNATLGATPTETLTIKEGDPPPTVSFAAATQTVNESGVSFSVSVNLSAASNVDTTVPFTLGGTAVNGTNYTGVSASPLVITAGSTTGTITGTLLDDRKFDSTNRTIVFTLGKPTNATLGTTTKDTLTIGESDPEPTVSLASSAQNVNESDGTFSVAVNLSAPSAVDTTVPFTLGGTAVSGTNYSGVLSPLVIKAGSASGTITGTLIDDGKFDTSGRTLTVTLGEPTNATLGATTSDTLSIAESDPEPTVSFARATQTVNEKDGSFSVAVNLSAASAVDTTVPFTLGGTAVNGTNYTGVRVSPLVIAAGSTTGTITGTLLDDGKFSASNTALHFTLGTPTNATLGATTASTLTIVESDPKPTTAFALMSDHSLVEVFGGAPTLLSPAGTILAVGGVIDGFGADVAFVIAADHTLWEHNPDKAGTGPFKSDGWALISIGSFQQISVATNLVGDAVAFGVLTDHSLWEYSSLFSGGHWLNLSAAGSILSVSAVTDAAGSDVAFVITADHRLWEHNAAQAGKAPFKADGWARVIPNALQSVSAGLNGAGIAVAYGILPDNSLEEYNPAFTSSGHLLILTPVPNLAAGGTIPGSSAGGSDEVFAITGDQNLWHHDLTGWSLFSGDAFQQVSARQTGGTADEVFGVLADGSLVSYIGGRHLLLAGGVLAVAAG